MFLLFELFTFNPKAYFGCEDLEDPPFSALTVDYLLADCTCHTESTLYLLCLKLEKEKKVDIDKSRICKIIANLEDNVARKVLNNFRIREYLLTRDEYCDIREYRCGLKRVYYQFRKRLGESKGIFKTHAKLGIKVSKKPIKRLYKTIKK